MTRARILADYVSSGDELALKAPIAGPTFTGTVAIPNVANLETAVVANTAKVTNYNQTLADINALDITELGTVTSGNLSNTAIVYPAGHVIQFDDTTDTQNLSCTGDGCTAVGTAVCTLSDCVSGNKIYININCGVFWGSYRGAKIGVQVVDASGTTTVMITSTQESQADKYPASVSYVHTVGSNGEVTVKRMVFGADNSHTHNWEMAPGLFGGTHLDTQSWGIMEVQA
jgi:hypothetical protein